MQTTTKSLAALAPQRVGLTGRRFSKAKSVADRLGICPRTLFRWADAGMIALHKINARVLLFDEMEVFAFIEASRLETHQSRHFGLGNQRLVGRNEFKE